MKASPRAHPQASAEFRDYLRAAANRYGKHADFAAEIGMSPGRFSHLITKGEHSLDELKCLRVARVTGEPPARIFRLAGKHEMAELLETLYGKQKPALSPSDRELLDLWDKLSQSNRDTLWTLIHELNMKQQKRQRKIKSA